MKTTLLLPFLALTLLPGVHRAEAQSTAFTYQGQLNENGSPASGTYDLRFRLAVDSSGNNFVGSPILSNALPVSGGLFTVSLDFGAGVFAGSNYWLQVELKTNGAGSYTTLAPLQRLTPTPYAIFANTASNLVGTLAADQLSGTYSSALTLNNAANQLTGAFTGNGSGLTGVNAATLGGLNSSSFWRTTGNAGTSPGANFVGTTDSQPLLLMGSFVGIGRSTRITSAEYFGVNAPVGGNAFGGMYVNTTNANGRPFYGYSQGGGVTAYHYVDGSDTNKWKLYVNGDRLTVTPGGLVGIGAVSPQASLHVSSPNSPTVVRVQATGTPGFSRLEFVSDPQGFANEWRPGFIQSSDNGNFTGGLSFFVNGTGAGSKFGSNEVMRLVNGSVGIGTASPQDAKLDVEGAMRVNDFDLYLRAGSERNHGLGYRASLAGLGGEGPLLYGFNGGALGVGNPDTAILTWTWDGHVTVSNSFSAANIMVDRNGANAGAIFPGVFFGGGNTGEGIASKRTAGGNQNGLDFYTAFQNRMSINNNGRVGIGTTNPASALHVIGTVTATAFNPPSDRNLKENFAPVSAREVLAKVAALPISRWNFIGEAATPHVGPMAQDFHAAFSLGTDDKHIATVDADGVALAAIQGLNQKLEEKDLRIAELERRLETLERLVDSNAKRTRPGQD